MSSPAQKLRNEIQESRVSARFQISALEAWSMRTEEVQERVEWVLGNTMRDFLMKSGKIKANKYILPRTLEQDGIQEYRAELYVFTPDELREILLNLIDINSDEILKVIMI